ncbi:hypothetical protein Zm00014a_013825, partial [Zea mays]
PSCARPPSPRPRRAWSSQTPRPWPLEPRAPLALSPSLFCAPADPSSTSPSLRARPSAAAITLAVPSSVPRRRWSSAAPFAPVSSAPTSATRDAPQFPLPLPISLCPRSPAVPRAAAEVRHRRPEPPSRHCRHRGVPGTRLEVRTSPAPSKPVYRLLPRLIPRRSRLMSPPSCFAVDRPPPVSLPRPSPHRAIPRALPNLPGRSGRPRDPPSARAPRLRRVLHRPS